LDINYLKHLREIYKRYSNINGKETEVIWQIIGRYAHEIEINQGSMDYESFGKYVANLIEEGNMK